MTTEASYNRTKPAPWDDIVALAAQWAPEAYDTPMAVSRRHAVKMLKELRGIDGAELENIAYYGLGLGMRHMLPAMLDPDRKSQLTEQLREQFQCSSLTPYELLGWPSSRETLEAVKEASVDVMTPIAVEAFNNLEPDEHLAADSLVQAMHLARLNLRPSWFMPSFSLEGIRGGYEAAQWAGLNALTGAFETLKLAACKRRATARPPLNAADLGTAPFRRLTAQVAKLHNEEISDDALLWRLFTTDAAGNAMLDQTVFPEQPAIAPAREDRPTSAFHTERLECPAFNVGGMKLLAEVVEVVWGAMHGPARPSDMPETGCPYDG